MCIRESMKRRVEALTLFAFSSENWGRPGEEVGALMGLFVEALDQRDRRVARQWRAARASSATGRVSGALADAAWRAAEERTAGNTALRLQIAVGYGGRWDIASAARQLAQRCVSGAMRPVGYHSRRHRGCTAAGGHCRIRISSSAPAARSASAISCCGTWHTPSCISATSCGRISTRSGFEAAIEFFVARHRRYGLTDAQSRGRRHDPRARHFGGL